MSTALPATLKPERPQEGDAGLEVVTQDVSAAGAFFVGPPRFPLGTRLRVHLRLSLPAANRTGFTGASRVEVAGKVVRAEPGGIAVAFSARYRLTPLEACETA